MDATNSWCMLHTYFQVRTAFSAVAVSGTRKQLHPPSQLHTASTLTSIWLQVDGAAACAIFSPDLETPSGDCVGHRLCNYSSYTLCELYAIGDAINLVYQQGVYAVIMCDSKPALHSFSSVLPTHSTAVQQILAFLAFLRQRILTVKFLSWPSHVGLSYIVTVDRLTKEACWLLPRDVGCPLSLTCYLSKVRSAALLLVLQRRYAEKHFSLSTTHYESTCRHKYFHRRWGLMVRRHNVVSTRLLLGYQPVRQVAGMESQPLFTACRLCWAPRADTIELYCMTYPTVQHVMPQCLPPDVVCRHLQNHNGLEDLLFRHSRFVG